MIGKRPRVYIEPSWGGDMRLVIVREGTAEGEIEVLRDFVWDTLPEGSLFDGMQGIGRADELIQAIVDRAWEAGFRPTGFKDIKNETAALREHLADMKTIAFHGLKITP